MKLIVQNIMLVIFFLSSQNVLGQSLDTISLTLEQAWKMAEQNHPDYQSQLISGQITDKQLDEALGKLLPQISGTFDVRYNIKRPTTILPGELVGRPGEDIPVQFGKFWNNTAGIEISQFVFDATILEDLKILSLNRQLDDVQAEVSLQNLKIDAIRSYLQVLINEARSKELKNNALALKNTLVLTQAKVDAELLNEIELERVENSYQNALSDIAKSEQAILLSRQLLNLVLGLPVDQPVVLLDELQVPDDFETTVAMETIQPVNLTNLPALRLQILQVSAIEAEMKKQQKALLPTASLYGYLGSNGVGDQPNWFNSSKIRWYGSSYVGLKLNWQFNAFFDNRQIMPQLTLKMQQAKLQVKGTQNDLMEAIVEAQSNLKSASEDIRIQQRNYKFAKKELNYLTIRFQNDLSTAKDLIEAEETMNAAQAGYWGAYYNFQVAAYELQKAKGEI